MLAWNIDFYFVIILAHLSPNRKGDFSPCRITISIFSMKIYVNVGMVLHMTYVQIVCCIIYYNTMTAKPNSSMVYQLAPPPLCSYATVSDWRIQCSNLDERTTDKKVLKILQNQDRSISYPARPKLIGKKGWNS